MDGNSGEQRQGRLAIELGRRAHFRVSTELSVRFQVVDSEVAGGAVIRNLGLAGARVDFDTEIRLPASVRLIIPGGPNTTGSPAFEVPGEVVWTVAEKSGGPFPSGVAFIAIDEDIKGELVALLDRLIS